MKDVPNREAFFRSAVAFASPSHRVVSFVGEVQGRITSAPRGNTGFGYDPIFEPYEGEGRTFGEMNLSQKNQLSHRASAVKKFADWYISQ
jgi:XTP/dITP diphosphohydrolase